MICHDPKHGFRNQNQFSRRLRTKVTVSLPEVVLGLLQLLHPVLDLQMGPGLLYIVLNESPFHTIWDETIFSKLVPNDIPWPKTLGLTPKTSL